MPVKNAIQTVRDTLHQVMAADDRVIILGQDVGVMGGVFGATAGLAEEFGERRVIDAPLAESSIVGIAIGAAMGGLLPIAEIQFADFIHSAIDQIISEAAKIRYRSNNDFSCPIVIRAPYGAGITGGLYHSQSVEALFFSTPGLKIAVPSTPYDVKGLLRSAIYDPDPVLFLEHKNGQVYRGYKEEVPDTAYSVPFGQAAIRREGQDLTVVSYGLAMHHAWAAAEELAKDGIDAEIVDLRTLLPLDRETILRSARKTGKILVVHEDNLTGGVGGELAAIIGEDAFWHLDAPVRRLASPDIPAMPYAPSLEKYALLNQEQVYAAMKELATY